MKKNRNTFWSRSVLLLLTLVLITLCATAGTLAKYVGNYTANDYARVAKFNVGSGFQTGRVSLFDELFEMNADGTVDVDTPETDAAASNEDRIVAPGTGGFFDIAMDGTAEVSLSYAIAFEDETDTGGIPLEFSLTNTAGGTWVSDITDLNSDTSLTGTVSAGTPVSNSVTVYWRWVYDAGRDAADTALGEAAAAGNAAQATVELSATVTQID